MEEGEIRRDPLRDRWVILAAERARRPRAFPGLGRDPAPGPCPFCPGAEGDTPPEAYALGPEGREADRPGWRVRVVPNLYPALREEAVAPAPADEGARAAARGVHEVVVESPRHGDRLVSLGAERLAEIVGVWGERVRALSALPEVRQVLLYRNEGTEAGATLSHPHTQILGLPRVPREVEEERSDDGCFYCRLLARETAAGDRVVAADPHMVTLAPFAPRVPYETWIVPRDHEASFAGTSPAVRRALAESLVAWGERMETTLGTVPFNLVLHTAPVGEESAAGYHWHVELLPRLTRTAAFEWGTGWSMNPVFPERAAAVLRGETDA